MSIVSSLLVAKTERQVLIKLILILYYQYFFNRVKYMYISSVATQSDMI